MFIYPYNFLPKNQFIDPLLQSYFKYIGKIEPLGSEVYPPIPHSVLPLQSFNFRADSI